MRAVNLIPADQRSGNGLATRSGGAAYLVLGLLAGLSVLALIYGTSRHEIQARRTEAAALSTRAQEVQAQAARLSPYTSFIAMREQRVHAVAELVGSRFDWPSAMAELSRVLPSDVSLSSVQGAIGAAGAAGAKAATAGAVSSATPPGATPTFTITGCATSQTVVAQTLVRLRLISGVNAVALQSSTKAGGNSGGSGSCSGSDPVFTVQVNFEPLPAAPALSTTTSSAAPNGSIASAAARANTAAASTPSTSGGSR
jgi:Tfp pilus assembly protein PilN